MKSRVIVFALAFLAGSLTLTAQRMALGQQQSPYPGSQSPFAGSPNSNMARSENSAITGSVHDTNSRPLENVRVELRSSATSVLLSVYTGPSGSFEFPLVASGSYVVVATSGVRQASERVDASGWSNVVNLRLPASADPADGINGNSISVVQYRIPVKARDEYRKAEELLAKGKAEEANKHLARALELCPNFADALTLRAVLKLNQHDDAGAVADLDKAVQSDPNYALAYIVLGAAWNYQSKFDDAIRSLQRGESLAPNSWQAHYEMGKAYLGKADYPAALHQLELAQNMSRTEYPVIQLLRANALLAMKQYPEAALAAQAFLEKEPQGPNSDQARKMLERAESLTAQNQAAKK